MSIQKSVQLSTLTEKAALEEFKRPDAVTATLKEVEVETEARQRIKWQIQFD